MGSLSIVRASAGSGKTYLLSVEYIAAAMRYPTAFRSILAVTFTNKATAEMKRRILTELSALAKGEQGGFFRSIAKRTGYPPNQIQKRASSTLSAILRDYSSFSVLTIDKFFQRIVRSFFRELGLDLHYQIEIDSNATLAEAIERLIERSHTDESLARKINRIVSEELDAGHRVDPHKALNEIAKSILTEDYSVSTADDDVLDKTFDTIKEQYTTACDSLRSCAVDACKLIEGAGLSVDDFKSTNRGFAAYFYKVAASRGVIPAYGANFRKAAESHNQEGYVTKAKINQVRPILPQLMAATEEVMQQYDRSLALRSTYSSIAASYSRYTLLRHLSAEFSELLASRGQLALSSTTELISSIVDGADVPFIFERLGNRYTTIFIDEFQDTSLGQWEGFLPLLHEAISKCDERCVMLIGDIKQAIYRFRGGDWRLLGGAADAEFEGFIEQSDSLTTSWRSERQIVEFNNAIMQHVVDSAEGKINDFLDGSPAQSDHLRSILPNAYADMKQSLPEGKGDGGYVETYRGDKEETLDWVVETVRKIATRQPLSRAAILVRLKSEGNRVASALIKAGVKIISDELLTVGSSASASFAVDVMKYSANPDPITLAAINHYLGQPFVAPLTAEHSSAIESLREMSSLEAFETIVRQFALQQSDPFYLQALYNLIYNYSKDHSTDIVEFISEWDKSLKYNKIALPEIEDAIRIITIHKAKGLEFDSVIIPFFSWDLFPAARPATTIWCRTQIEPYDQFNPIPLTYGRELGESVYADQYIEQGVSSVVDNVNLIYVAITRAKSELYLGLGDGVRAKASAALLSDAVIDYLRDATSIGQPSPACNYAKDSSVDIIEFDRFESYPAPPLSMDQ